MLTHPRPPRAATRLIQASKRPLVATWLEDPFWYFTHFCATGAGMKGKIVPCVRSVRQCVQCEENLRSTGRGRTLHAGAAAVVQFVASAPRSVEKTDHQLVYEFRALPEETRSRYGAGGELPNWVSPELTRAARNYARDEGTLMRLPPPVLEAGTTVAIVELLAPVADVIQGVIGADLPWRGTRTAIVPRRSESGLLTSVQLLDSTPEPPSTFQGIVAFLDEHWQKFGVRATDAT